jgi:hypothetical protein
MKVNVNELNTLLKNTKPIWSTTGTIPHNEWVFFSGDMFYCFNGYHFYSQPFEGPIGAFPAPSLIQILSRAGETIELIGGNNSSAIKGKTKAEFDYPFKLEEHVKSFYLEQEEFVLTRDFNKALELCTRTIFKDNIEYSNCYVVNNRMFSTDGYRISVVDTQCPNCSVPINTSKMLFDEVRGIVVNNRWISFKIGDGILSAMKNIGHENSVLKHVPACDFDVKLTFTNASEAIDILSMINKFDIDFKKKDISVKVEVRDGVVTIEMNGNKASVSEQTQCESNTDVSFIIHPLHLIDSLSISSKLFLSTTSTSELAAKGGWLAATDEGVYQYLWVELCG